MTARRQARARASIALDASDGVPRCLKIGRCIEVWAADDPADTGFRSFRSMCSARVRYGQARAGWLTAVGIDDRAGWALISAGAPWSAGRLELDAPGRARLKDRMAHAGCTPSDIPVLREEATRLFDLVYTPDADNVPRGQENP